MKQKFLSLVLVATVAALAGCAGSAARQSNGNLARPMVTPEIRSDRPKIIAFGDSLTAGFGLLEKESMPYLLQEKLAAEGFDYEVINAGVSGDTTLGGLERIDWVLEMENVQILILELGGNDLLRRMPVKDMKRNLAQIIERAQAKNVRVLLCGMFAPPNVGAEYQRDFQMSFPDLAEQYKTNFLPFLLDGVALNKDLNQPDGIHPNAEGSKIMTANVYKALQPMLKK